MLQWFDGHLDLTYIALHGRDLRCAVPNCGGTLQPASLTFPALADGGVTRAFSTLFVRRKTAEETGAYCFSNEQEAFESAQMQVKMHCTWEAEGWVTGHEGTVKSERGFGPLRVYLAMEGAVPLRTVEDAAAFHEMGVRMVSLAWAEGSKWAGGDQSGGDLTREGRELVERLDELGIVHDVSHLSEKAFWSLLECARGRVVASHSNCLALLPGAKSPQRHLNDAQIRALASRAGSLIGLNMFARFIIGPEELSKRRATIADLLAHMKHVEDLTGRRDLLALGSDFDSGFGTDLLPVDLQGPQDLVRLAEAMSAGGWSDAEIAGFADRWDACVS